GNELAARSAEDKPPHGRCGKHVNHTEYFRAPPVQTLLYGYDNIYVGMTSDGSGGDCYLVSYDVLGAARSVATRVCQLVFGRRRIRGDHVREEPGLIHRAGVVWIGQSVLAMPVKEAADLGGRLRRLGFGGSAARWRIPRSSAMC